MKPLIDGGFAPRDIRFSRRLRKLAHVLQAGMSGMNHVLDESLRGSAITRIYDGQNYEYRRSNTQSDPCAGTS